MEDSEYSALLQKLTDELKQLSARMDYVTRLGAVPARLTVFNSSGDVRTVRVRISPGSLLTLL